MIIAAKHFSKQTEPCEKKMSEILDSHLVKLGTETQNKAEEKIEIIIVGIINEDDGQMNPFGVK